MEGLYERLEAQHEIAVRDRIFEDMPLPPLGLSRLEKSRYAQVVMTRLEAALSYDDCVDVLKDSLRQLPDSHYQDAKRDCYEVCGGDIKCYLQLKGEKFLNQLRNCRAKGELFFGQEITEDVIAFVEQNPEIGQGVFKNGIVYETKIPYMTQAYLEAEEPREKRYYYCHCPWIRESLQKWEKRVSATFCHCSSGFHKKPYEIIFGKSIRAEVLKSVLKGDDVCRFAIHVPNAYSLWKNNNPLRLSQTGIPKAHLGFSMVICWIRFWLAP